jgi:uncharacterized protein with NAD-binding domain and iron-sulfur cluster
MAAVVIAGLSDADHGARPMSATPKRRVAVLGGGIGALAAAYKLTTLPDWQDRFEITVHQLGWRLGGKGASGRNAGSANRIEEHGLHVWAGFYENAFRMMNDIYRNYARPQSPIQSIQQAFLKQSHIVLAEQYRGRWLEWPLYYPPNDSWPGDGSTGPPSITQYLLWLTENLQRLHSSLPAEIGSAALRAIAFPDQVQRLVPEVLERARSETPRADLLLQCAHAIAVKAHAKAVKPADAAISICWSLDLYRVEFLTPVAAAINFDDTQLRRDFILLDLVSCVIAAIINDGVLTEGFQAIDGYDVIELLNRHHAFPQTVASAPVVSGYDYTFAYEGGDHTKPLLSAASALEGFLRLLFGYKGALFFKMAAGAGDVIFAPIYEVLRDRGVKFEFFHRVLELVPKDGRIEQIQIAIQATPIADIYEPLVDLDGLLCWPSEPLYELLTNGQVLKDCKIDLEDDYQTYSIDQKTLNRGCDFDDVILGIPPGALTTICAKLAVPGSKWKAMLGGLPTVCTQALQLWSDCALQDFGGPFVAPQCPPDSVGPTCTSFAPPFDTWADMSHLLVREDWGAGAPKNIAYFCAVLPDPPPVPGGGDPLPEATAQVRANAVAWLNDDIGNLWPNSVGEDGFRWSLLHAQPGKVGEARLDDQYWRANISGAERYVLSVPGTLSVRLPPSPTEYANLYLAGDWVRVAALNAGCMEVAVMAGLGAAASLAGCDDGVIA